MTEVEFITAHTLNIINDRFIVNFNFNPTRDEGPPFFITSLTVPIFPKKYNQEINSSNQVDIKNVLEQASSIKFSLLTQSGGEVFLETDIINKSYYQQGGTGGSSFVGIGGSRARTTSTPFYYFQITPIEIPDDILDLSISESEAEQNDLLENRQVVFEPFITNLQFGFSEFNATISNAVENRRSKFIQESDRNITSIQPSNIEAILARIANPAQIQDSLYYTTGWSRGRYDGVKTSRLNYGNIPATISGIAFNGQEYTREAEDTVLCNIEREERFSNEYLFSGKSNTPTVEYKLKDGEEIAALTESNISIALDVITIAIDNATQIPQEGDIIELRDPEKNPPFDETYRPEIVEIREVTVTSATTADLLVRRKLFGTEKYVHPNNTEVRIIDENAFIFKFQENGSSIEKVSDKKVWVSAENTILLVSPKGTVVTKWICNK